MLTAFHVKKPGELQAELKRKANPPAEGHRVTVEEGQENMRQLALAMGETTTAKGIRNYQLLRAFTNRGADA